MIYDERTMKIYHRRLSNLFSECDAWCRGCMRICRCTYIVGTSNDVRMKYTRSAFRTITPNDINVLIRIHRDAITIYHSFVFYSRPTVIPATFCYAGSCWIYENKNAPYIFNISAQNTTLTITTAICVIITVKKKIGQIKIVSFCKM